MSDEQRRLITEHTYACLQFLYCFLMLNLATEKQPEAEQQYAIACDTYLQRAEKKAWA